MIIIPNVLGGIFYVLKLTRSKAPADNFAVITVVKSILSKSIGLCRDESICELITESYFLKLQIRMFFHNF